jgi:hypothetical protein
MLGAYFVDAWICQTDCVDHPAFKLRHSRRTSTVTALNAHGLGDEASERVEPDDPRELATICRGSGGKQHWILKFDSRGGDC